MARSPSDATRFTATGPHIAANPSPNSPGTFSSNPAYITPGRSGPAGESPQQKIARLRAAAALAKRGTETSFDRTVRIGRKWADRAHRVTTFGLIGLTVLSGAVATAGITDMLLHNRRRRNDWLAEKQAQTARDIAVAKEAIARGNATEDQVLLLNRERAADEAALAKKNRPGVFKRATNWIYGDLSVEERQKASLDAMAAASADVPQDHVQLPAIAIEPDGTSDRPKFFGRDEPVAGGPLDRHAQLVFDSASNTARSWTSWFRRT